MRGTRLERNFRAYCSKKIGLSLSYANFLCRRNLVMLVLGIKGQYLWMIFLCLGRV